MKKEEKRKRERKKERKKKEHKSEPNDTVYMHCLTISSRTDRGTGVLPTK